MAWIYVSTKVDTYQEQAVPFRTAGAGRNPAAPFPIPRRMGIQSACTGIVPE